jgi:hypothetical protein
LFVKAFNVYQMLLQWLDDRLRQDGHTILLPLGVPDRYLEAIEIRVLNAKPQGFDSPQTTSVEKLALRTRSSSLGFPFTATTVVALIALLPCEDWNHTQAKSGSGT